ncbi:MAG: hypothetical protein ACRD1H_14450, partial [Vicinamibacterales bacterium]
MALARGYSSVVARAAWLEGLVAFARNDFGAAQVGYEEMFDAAVAAGDVEQTAFAHGLLANLYAVLGDMTAAWRHRVDAAAMLDDVNNPQVVANLLLSAAGDAWTSGNYSAALVFQSTLLSLGLPISQVTEIQALAQRSRTLHQLGRHSESIQSLDMAHERLSRVPDRGVHARIEPDVLAADAEVFRRLDRARAIA